MVLTYHGEGVATYTAFKASPTPGIGASCYATTKARLQERAFCFASASVCKIHRKSEDAISGVEIVLVARTIDANLGIVPVLQRLLNLAVDAVPV